MIFSGIKDQVLQSKPFLTWSFVSKVGAYFEKEFQESAPNIFYLVTASPIPIATAGTFPVTAPPTASAPPITGLITL